jgi:hypothetical protein
MKVFGASPSQPPLVRVAALEAFKSPLSGYQDLAALRRKTQGTMPSGGEEEDVASTTTSGGLPPGGGEKYVVSLASAESQARR